MTIWSMKANTRDLWRDGWAAGSIADYPRHGEQPGGPRRSTRTGSAGPGRADDRADRRGPDDRRRRGGRPPRRHRRSSTPAARERMQEARDVIEALVAAGAVVYGVTTGFGDLATVSIEPDDGRRLQENLLMSHAAGVGPAVPARDRPGDAAAARQHPGPRPQRLPAAARRSPARVPRRGHPPGGAGAGEPRRVGRPGAARPPGAAADRPRAGGVPRGRSSRRSSPFARRAWTRWSSRRRRGSPCSTGPR